MAVTGKLKSKLKGEIIKRTVLSAYFAAVSLPMYVALPPIYPQVLMIGRLTP